MIRLALFIRRQWRYVWPLVRPWSLLIVGAGLWVDAIAGLAAVGRGVDVGVSESVVRGTLWVEAAVGFLCVAVWALKGSPAPKDEAPERD